ncbi:MAG: hypothetical protein PHU40_06315 [Sulfurimonas sp.]|nr:hypothetical protein [Sulfurimonas sp.]
MTKNNNIFVRTEMDFAKKMKEIGIHLSSLPEYKNAEQYAKTIKKTSVQRHTQVAFTASL